jgi:N-acetyl-anhydromuramyl-L-alanine amidase AmpD
VTVDNGRPKIQVLDPEWFSDVEMEKIVVHWTAGTYDISDNDRSHYHFLIDKNGAGYKGDNPVSGNAREDASGEVTSHVKNMNTGSIGISVAAMGNAIEYPFDAGDWPMTRIQFLALCKACAELAEFYKIPVVDDRVLMHGEVQENCGVEQSGKWDIGHLPWTDKYTSSAGVGDFMRTIIQKIIDGEFEPVLPPPAAVTVYVYVDAPPGMTVTVKQENLE